MLDQKKIGVKQISVCAEILCQQKLKLATKILTGVWKVKG